MPQRKYNVENASLYTAFSRLGRYDFIWLGPFVKSFGWQHHLISVVFFLSQVVCPAQESIQFGRVSPGSVDEREVKPGQEEGSACLLAVQVLGSRKYVRFRWSFRISMVCLVPSRMFLHSSRP